ncbi:MAG: hypothetical protein OQJ84_03080 [Xanthomonadales bacterium]|nr:hypothetical protein [Xanthomonadales bacterium]
MKHCLKPVHALTAIALFFATPSFADEEKSLVVSIETDDISLTEMDVGSLAIGESKTIETETGQVIDLLRTVDDVEIYINGELVDIGFGHDPDSQIHVIRKHVEFACDEEDESSCEKHVVIRAGDDHDVFSWALAEDAEMLLPDDIEITCFSDEDGDCVEHMAWITEGGEINIGSLHEEHLDVDGHKFIIITSKADSDG